jgi:hypothetical protein
MQIDTIVLRTTSHGNVTAVIHTPENDLTEGLEGCGDALSEALHDLADQIEEASC